MAERTLRILNKILDTIIAIVLILAVLYSVYSLWDNYQLYQGIQDLQVKLKDLKPKGKKPSFEELRKINPDVVAWITLDGTKIDEPVVQGKQQKFSGFIFDSLWTLYGKAFDVWRFGII